MFESVGELAVISVLFGVTVLAFLYLGYRGAHGKGTKEELQRKGQGKSSA